MIEVVAAKTTSPARTIERLPAPSAPAGSGAMISVCASAGSGMLPTARPGSSALWRPASPFRLFRPARLILLPSLSLNPTLALNGQGGKPIEAPQPEPDARTPPHQPV